MSSETVSDERLKLWFFRDLSSEQRLRLFRLMEMPVDEIGQTHGHQQIALNHVLQSLRSKPVASRVEVKPLEWKGPDENTAYGEQGGFVYTVMSPNRTPGWRVWVHLKSPEGLSASVGGVIITVKAESRDAAIAAAEADYRNRILSALLPKATAPVVSEPVAFVNPVTLERLAERRDHTTAILMPSPKEGATTALYVSPQPKAVTEEMVERAMASIEGEPDLFITKGALRYALKAAMKEA